MLFVQEVSVVESEFRKSFAIESHPELEPAFQFLRIHGWSVGFFDAYGYFAVGQSRHLEDDLADARSQVDKLVVRADGLELVDDLANQFETRFSVDL